MSWIADCSIAAAWCFDDEKTPRTEELLDRIETDSLIVPTHWPLEIGNVLRTAVRRKRLTEKQCCDRLAILMALPVRYHTNSHRVALDATYHLAQKFMLTTYDAAYLELALRLEIPFATNDQDLISAAKKIGASLL